MFIHFDIGDIGIDISLDPNLNLETTALEPAYIFALVDLYRVDPKPEFLAMAEKIGDNLLQGRQHSDSGLFTLEDDYVFHSRVMDKPELQEGHEGKTVSETPAG